MAPELYEEKYGVSVDIYAFGMCFLEMCTLSTPYKEWDNPAQIYKKVIQGVKPQAFDRIDDPEVADFIVSCIEYRDVRPTARDLLECKFLKDLESDVNNFPVKLKTKKELKAKKLQKEEGKRNNMGHSHLNPNTNDGFGSPLPQRPSKAMKQGTMKNQSRRQQTIQNQEESLNLFNQIENEKHLKLKIDVDSVNLTEPHLPPELKNSQDDAHSVIIQRDQELSENHLNKSSDNINSTKQFTRLPHQSTHSGEEVERVNTSFERKETFNQTQGYPLQDEHFMKQGRVEIMAKKDGYKEQQNPTTTSNTAYSLGSPEPLHKSSEEKKRPVEGIMWKLRNVSPDRKILKFGIIFSPDREIGFDYNLEEDTPGKICQELKQADFGITEHDYDKIEESIASIVKSTIEKINSERLMKSSSVSTSDLKSSTSAEVMSSPKDSPHHHSKGFDKSVDRSQKWRQAELAVNHFIQKIGSEIQKVYSHKDEIVELGQQTDSESWKLSIQFIKDVTDSYRNFQTSLSKSINKSKKGPS